MYDKSANKVMLCYATLIVIFISGPLGAGDIAWLKCWDLTKDESRQCRRFARFLISVQNSMYTQSNQLLFSLPSILIVPQPQKLLLV